MITDIIFDLGGVIILQGDFGLHSLDKEFGLEAGTLNKIASDVFEQKSTKKDFDEVAYFQKKYQGVLSLDKYQRAITCLNNSEKTNEPLLDWIRQHKSQYRISLLTNNSPSLGMILHEKFGISDLFDNVFNSVEIGWSKPSLQIFEYALGKLSAKSRECVFVDDNPGNVESAVQLGLAGIVFRDNASLFAQFDKLGL